MKCRGEAGIFRTLLLVGMLTLTANIQRVSANGTIYHVDNTSAQYVIESVETSFIGYTLFVPLPSTTVYLINNSGDVVHTWAVDYIPGLSVYLLENGNLLYSAYQSGGTSKRVQEIEWDGTVIWNVEYSSDQHRRHHDIAPLPNGNVLMIAWEVKTAAEAIAAGRDPDFLRDGELWPDHVIEVEPAGATEGNIVWEWHVWDHLIQDFDSSKENYGVVADHPELVDINIVRKGPNAGQADWNHMNSIDYNEELDQILLSVNAFNEIWVIDHNTTTEEASGHTGGNSGKGGDILYRWGNPQNYRAGDASDKKFFKQHDAQWIRPGYPGEGNMLIFNNGNNRPDGTYSSVDEIELPVDVSGNYFLTPGSAYGPEEQIWIYTAENRTSFHSWHISGAQRLPNGNTLICNGEPGYFFEVTPENATVWEYTNPFPGGEFNSVFKIRRYAPDFPGLVNLMQVSDIAITDVTTDKTIMYRGYNYRLNATVENQGDFTETFNVTAYANTTIIQTLNVTNLPTGNSTTITFTWNTTSFSYGNYTMSANATIIPGETETADNTFVDGTVLVTISGDVDGSFDVGFEDFMILAAAYGTSIGDLNYDDRADFDGDGDVGFDDFMILAANYGMSV